MKFKILFFLLLFLFKLSGQYTFENLPVEIQANILSLVKNSDNLIESIKYLKNLRETNQRFRDIINHQDFWNEFIENFAKFYEITQNDLIKIIEREDIKLIRALRRAGITLTDKTYINNLINFLFWGGVTLSRLQKILEAGLDPNYVREDGENLWYPAAFYAHSKEYKYQAVKLLLDYGLDVNNMRQVNDSKFSLLDWSVDLKNDKLVELLIERGTDVNIKDNHGKIPLDNAIGKNSEKESKSLINIINLLMEAQARSQMQSPLLFFFD